MNFATESGEIDGTVAVIWTGIFCLSPVSSAFWTNSCIFNPSLQKKWTSPSARFRKSAWKSLNMREILELLARQYSIAKKPPVISAPTDNTPKYMECKWFLVRRFNLIITSRLVAVILMTRGRQKNIRGIRLKPNSQSFQVIMVSGDKMPLMQM